MKTYLLRMTGLYVLFVGIIFSVAYLSISNERKIYGSHESEIGSYTYIVDGKEVESDTIDTSSYIPADIFHLSQYKAEWNDANRQIILRERNQPYLKVIASSAALFATGLLFGMISIFLNNMVATENSTTATGGNMDDAKAGKN